MAKRTIKPISWADADRRRAQQLQATRQGWGAQVNNRKIHTSMRPKMESGRVWLCSRCNILNEALKCRSCGQLRFAGLFSKDMGIAEQQFRDMLRRQRS